MHSGRTIFAQLIRFLPDREFRRCVNRYHGNKRVRSFPCWDQFLAQAFAQLTYHESLRDIEACLGSLEPKLYHLGFRGPVARSTLADANESRDWRISADFAQLPIARARRLYAHDPLGIELDTTLYAFNAHFTGLPEESTRFRAWLRFSPGRLLGAPFLSRFRFASECFGRMRAEFQAKVLKAIPGGFGKPPGSVLLGRWCVENC